MPSTFVIRRARAGTDPVASLSVPAQDDARRGGAMKFAIRLAVVQFATDRDPTDWEIPLSVCSV